MGCAESKSANANKLEKLDSLEKHKSAMDDYMKQMEMDASQLESSDSFKVDTEEIDRKIAKLKAKMAAGEIDEEAFRKKLDKKFDKTMNPEKEAMKATEELRKKTRDSQRANVLNLWWQFDANGDGVLDKEENRNLVKTYFARLKTNYPKILKTQLDASLVTYMKVVKAKIYTKLEKDENGTPDIILHTIMDEYLDKFEADQKATNDKLLQQVMVKVSEELGKMEEESDKIADELLVKMDLDGDGSVVRGEFEQSFCELMEQVFDVSKIVDPIVAVAQKDLEVQLLDMVDKAKQASKRYQQAAQVDAKAAHDEEVSKGA
eukprot:gnl/MRDRNA2_/MRDRNA2_94578_c0_seq2.p1 gnl/MRDRNA2_/MRDRNA2_94578_c0~~gnl/MRDRNA2_/MRDRNA2_94578_c0_seq2.p1  ORF type:complete len:319 (+),score=108.07 gnl/MRDRNA2_/MRDRNA2_94578_c0_seq2:114-1070(+)